MKKASIAALIALASTIAALWLPTGKTLELYDVEDLVYTMGGFPSIEISLAPVEVDVLTTGTELAEQLQWLVPADTPLDFQNGFILIRGTVAQQAAVRGCIEARRLRNRLVQRAAVAIHHTKTTLSAAVFGIISR